MKRDTVKGIEKERNVIKKGKRKGSIVRKGQTQWEEVETLSGALR